MTELISNATQTSFTALKNKFGKKTIQYYITQSLSETTVIATGNLTTNTPGTFVPPVGTTSITAIGSSHSACKNVTSISYLGGSFNFAPPTINRWDSEFLFPVPYVSTINYVVARHGYLKFIITKQVQIPAERYEYRGFKLSEYYSASTSPFPTSGQIKFSDFYKNGAPNTFQFPQQIVSAEAKIGSKKITLGPLFVGKTIEIDAPVGQIATFVVNGITYQNGSIAMITSDYTTITLCGISPATGSSYIDCTIGDYTSRWNFTVGPNYQNFWSQI